MLLPYLPNNFHYLQANNVNSFVSSHVLHAYEIDIMSINSNRVKKEPGTGSVFPIRTFETSVIYSKKRNKELVPVPGS